MFISGPLFRLWIVLSALCLAGVSAYGYLTLSPPDPTAQLTLTTISGPYETYNISTGQTSDVNAPLDFFTLEDRKGEEELVCVWQAFGGYTTGKLGLFVVVSLTPKQVLATDFKLPDGFVDCLNRARTERLEKQLGDITKKVGFFFLLPSTVLLLAFIAIPRIFRWIKAG